MSMARRGGRERGQWKRSNMPRQDPPLNCGGGGDNVNGPLECDLCELWKFSKEDELLNHKIREHSEFYEFECGQCDQLFGGLEEMEKHFKRRHMNVGADDAWEENTSTVQVQEEINNLEREVDAEVTKAVVEVDDNFEEDDGGGDVDDFEEDGGEIEDDGDEFGGDPGFKCDFCPKSYPWKSELTIHLRSHSGEMPYKCGECGQAFAVHRSMVDHQKRHNKMYEYFCEVVGCGKGFVKKQDRDRHEVKGHVPLHLRQDFKNNQCDICGKNFANSTHLKIHVNGVHGKGPGYPCHLCGKIFGHQSSLRSHLQSKKHGGTGLSFRNKKKNKKNGGTATPSTTSLEESSVKNVGGDDEDVPTSNISGGPLARNFVQEPQILPPPTQLTTVYPNAGFHSQFIPNFHPQPPPTQSLVVLDVGQIQGERYTHHNQQGTVTLQDAFQMAYGIGGGGVGVGGDPTGPTIPFS